LTVRDLEKQEREKSANSLESFIFETQVRAGYKEMRIPGEPAEVFYGSLADVNVRELSELGDADLKSPAFIFQSLFLLPLGFPSP